MKLSLSLKLSIFVLVLFALVIATCLLWTPVKIRYYLAKFDEGNFGEKAECIEALVKMGDSGKKGLARKMAGLDGYMLINVTEAVFEQVTNGRKRIMQENQLYTNLHLAALGGMIDTVKTMIENGNNVNLQTIEGETPLDWAILARRKNVVEYLRARGGKTGKELTNESSVKSQGSSVEEEKK